MCGIVGYVGAQQALPILLRNLNLLTYRGYDSAGVAVSYDNALSIVKKAGKVHNLEAEIADAAQIPGNIGIGHTRWATHGPPTDLNAHPHTDCKRFIALVHNGIVENYYTLRQELLAKGHTFVSETDTEVLAHLIEECYQGDLTAAVRQAMQRVRGSLAIAVLCRDEDKIVAAKLDTPPLIIGLGRGENFIASDIPALLEYTNKVYILEDGEIAELTSDGVKISSFLERPPPRVYERQVTLIEWTAEMAERGGYPHYMLKEIHEQPATIRDTLRGRIDTARRRVLLENFDLDPRLITEAKRLTIVACGTAYHAGLVGKYLLEEFLRLPTEVDVGSEYRYRHPIVERGDIVVAISQSGETADTIASAKEAQAHGATVVAITNVVGSTISRLADATLYTRAGPEIAVASTKAFVGQLIGLDLLLLYLAQFRLPRRPPTLEKMLDELGQLADKTQRILDDVGPIQDLAREIAVSKACFFIGRHVDEPIAREGSLKLKEISYIHSQGYAAGELKHGTLALMEEDTPVIALATQHNLYEKMLSNIQEVLARRAPVIPLVQEGSEDLQALRGRRIEIPRTHSSLAPVLAVIPLQLLAYYCGLERGCDIDQPRNLAKSVTVE